MMLKIFCLISMTTISILLLLFIYVYDKIIHSAEIIDIFSLKWVQPAHVVTTVKQPYIASHLYLKVTFYCPVLEIFIWIEPLLRSHLSYKDTFSLSQRWPLNTGLTTVQIEKIFIHNQLSSFEITYQLYPLLVKRPL